MAAHAAIVIIPFLAGFTLALLQCLDRKSLQSIPRYNFDYPRLERHANNGSVDHPKNGIFATIRSSVAALTSCRRWMEQGYAQYTQHGFSFAMPDINGRITVIMPLDKLRKNIDKTSNGTSFFEGISEELQGHFNFVHPMVASMTMTSYAVRRYVSNLEGAIEPAWALLASNIDRLWAGEPGVWKTVDAGQTMVDLMLAEIHRYMLGEPFCRDVSFAQDFKKFAMQAKMCIVLGPWTPGCLQPLLTWLNRRCASRLRDRVTPVVEQRIAEIQAAGPCNTNPSGLMDWMIVYDLGQKKGSGQVPDATVLVSTYLGAAFGWSIGTSGTFTNVLLDILSTSPDDAVLAIIRDEVTAAYASCDGKWTKQAVDSLVKTESAILESTRVSPLHAHGVWRKVVKAGGFPIPGEEWTAPEGAVLCADLWNYHHDPELWSEPSKYDAFRFAREAPKDQSAVNNKDALLTFGIGKHNCKGQAHIMQVSKLLLAYILMNYDLEHMPSRPQNRWFGYIIRLPANTIIRIRRRAVNS